MSYFCNLSAGFIYQKYHFTILLVPLNNETPFEKKTNKETDKQNHNKTKTKQQNKTTKQQNKTKQNKKKKRINQ